MQIGSSLAVVACFCTDKSKRKRLNEGFQGQRLVLWLQGKPGTKEAHFCQFKNTNEMLGIIKNESTCLTFLHKRTIICAWSHHTYIQVIMVQAKKIFFHFIIYIYAVLDSFIFLAMIYFSASLVNNIKMNVKIHPKTQSYKKQPSHFWDSTQYVQCRNLE